MFSDQSHLWGSPNSIPSSKWFYSDIMMTSHVICFVRYSSHNLIVFITKDQLVVM